MQEMDARPPYVMFEVRPVEDRAASIEQGRYVAKDVIFAVVTPAGTKDKIEKVAEDWFAGIKANVREGRFPAQWLTAYEAQFEAFKKNEEVPEIGTPIKTWPALSPAQVKNILGANIRTVEDLADANEEALMRIGMGSRGLKDKAKAWLQSAEKKGIPAEKLAALEAENTQLREDNEKLNERVAQLEKAQKSEDA